MTPPKANMEQIRDSFMARFAGVKKVDELEALKFIGEPLFTTEEITETAWPLDRLLRKLCVDNRITDAYFNERYKIYAYVKLGLHPTKACNNKNNIMKAIKKGHITYTKLVEVASKILGFEISNMVFTFNAPAGSRQTISLADAPEQQQ